MATLGCTAILFVQVSILLPSCTGQVTNKQSDVNLSEQQSSTSVSTKLVKTQGSGEHQNIRCSLQDKHGNLWFGTMGEGVYRYDGNEFTQFTVEDGLGNNTIWSILEDRSGNIWFGTDDGVSCFDGRNISTVPILPFPSLQVATAPTQSPKNPVWCMLQDRNGVIWFGTTKDLYCYDGKTFSRFLDMGRVSNTQGLQLTWIQSLLEDRTGKIWMGSGPIASEGVIQYDGKNLTSSKPNADGWIKSMVEDSSGLIWFGGRNNGNFTYNGKAFAGFTDKVGIGNPILVDKLGAIWFSGEEALSTVESDGGIWRFDGEAFENFSTKDGLGKYSVWSMLQDRDGDIWIGARNCELYRYDGKAFHEMSE